MIALSIDNQWTVEGHTWLPYKTNQFHVQHDFRFRLIGPCSSVRGKHFFQCSQIFIIVEMFYQ